MAEKGKPKPGTNRQL